MAVYQPQFEGGGPPVLVRNTFLDIDDRPPTPVALQRAKTAPPPRSGNLVSDDDSRPARPEEDSSSSEEEDEDEDDEADHLGQPGDNSVEAGEMSPNTPLERTVIRDRYENREDWKWAGHSAPSQGNSVNTIGPNASPGTAPAAGNTCTEAQPMVMYPASVGLVPMMPVVMTPLGPEGAAEVGLQPQQPQQPQQQQQQQQQQQPPPDRGQARWPEPRVAAPLVVSSGTVPAGMTGFVGLQGAEESLGAPVAAPQPQTLTRAFSINSGYFRVHWTVDARKLRGNDKQAVSPPFELSFGNQFPNVTFKMMIYPKVMNDSKGGASFKKARGRGFVQLKCEAELSEAIANVKFRIAIGSGENQQAPRGPKKHNFSASAVCGLDKEQDEWDFASVVDSESMTFVVCLEIVPHSSE